MQTLLGRLQEFDRIASVVRLGEEIWYESGRFGKFPLPCMRRSLPPRILFHILSRKLCEAITRLAFAHQQTQAEVILLTVAAVLDQEIRGLQELADSLNERFALAV